MSESGAPTDLALDQDLCMGSGYCTRAYPELFSLTDEGIAELKMHAPYGDKEISDAHIAAHMCPAGAIEVSEPGNRE